MYPNSPKVTPIKVVSAESARTHRSNTYALGYGIIRKIAAKSMPEEHYCTDGANMVTSRRRTLQGESGITASLAAGGFTLTDCDDPDQGGDPVEAAADARERALALQAEVQSDFAAAGRSKSSGLHL